MQESNQVEKSIQSEESPRSQPIDSTLKEQLALMAIEDQTLRLLLPEITTKFGRESGEYEYIWSLIHRQDSICQVKLIKILEDHGWVGKSRVGNNANQALWLIVQHSALTDQEKYLPLLQESAANSAFAPRLPRNDGSFVKPSAPRQQKKAWMPGRRWMMRL